LLLGGDLPVRNMTRRRYIGVGLYRSGSFQETGAKRRDHPRFVPVLRIAFKGVGEIIKFLGLPGTQPFGHVHHAVQIPRSRNLFRENRGITGKVECFRGDHAGGLMIPVIFAGDLNGQQGHDYFRPSDADKPDYFVERMPVPPMVER
jgi:hypothetical protein